MVVFMAKVLWACTPAPHPPPTARHSLWDALVCIYVVVLECRAVYDAPGDTLDAYKRVYRLELVAVVRPVATRSYVTDSPVASASPVYLLVPDWSLLSCICGARVRPRRVLLTRVTGLSPYLLDFVDAGWTSFSRRPRPIDDLWATSYGLRGFLLEGL